MSTVSTESVNIDWEQLSFSLTPVRSMYVATLNAGERWHTGDLQPFGDIPMSPAAGILNYGQGVFEGMKAQRNHAGEIVLFRPDVNARRFARSAQAVCIPPVPDALFLDAVEQVVQDNIDYIPPCDRGSLYIRPLLIGSGGLLGNAPAPSYTFIVFASPVGNYFSNGLAPIALTVCEDYHRSAPKGMGAAKFAGNYAGCYPSTLASKAAGFAMCIYLDAKESRYIEEAGSANIFFVKGDKLVTPPLGCILPGITRDAILTIASEELGLSVEERNIDIDEALTLDECFCTGTAAVITPVGRVQYRESEVVYCNDMVGPVTRRLYDAYRAISLGDVEDTRGWVKTVA